MPRMSTRPARRPRRGIPVLAAAVCLILTGVRLAEASVVGRDNASAAPFMAPRVGDDAQSLYAVGSMYLDGQGKPQDFVAARAAFRASAEQGYWRAQLALGIMARRGAGGRPDLAQALGWYRKAARSGQSDAERALGLLLAVGGPGIERNDGEAVAWLSRAARQGDRSAALDLGTLLQEHRMYTDALPWLRLASERGDADAPHSIASLYEYGFGVPEDPHEALRWHLVAAARGNADSLFRLGDAYLDGRHAAENRVEAYRWLLIALRSGRSEGASPSDIRQAEIKRSILAAMMQGDQIRAAEILARDWSPAPPVAGAQP
jgi:TPR repeat protein